MKRFFVIDGNQVVFSSSRKTSAWAFAYGRGQGVIWRAKLCDVQASPKSPPKRGKAV